MIFYDLRIYFMELNTGEAKPHFTNHAINRHFFSVLKRIGSLLGKTPTIFGKKDV